MTNEQNDKMMLNDKDFQDLVKKARRKSVVRNIFIAFIVSMIVLIGLYLLGDFVMKWKIEKETRIDSAWNQIQGANIEEQGTSYNYSFFSANSRTELIKMVGDVPVPWGERDKYYTMFGTSRTGVTSGPSGSGTITDERLQLYFNGERAITFYHPEVNYDQMFNDIQLLDEIGDDKWIELAFSFDKGYTIQEVQEAFDNNDLAWYWVDTYSESEIKEMNEMIEQMPNGQHAMVGDGLNGFQHFDHPDAEPAANFIHSLQFLQKEGGYKQAANDMVQAITENSDQDLSPEQLEIIGVVVTGLPEDLTKYVNNPMIRAATLGVTTDRY